jgi:uncharacterized protein
MVIYLLAMRLPKMEYMGTGAVFFLLLNLFKLPFMIGLGLITPAASSSTSRCPGGAGRDLARAVAPWPDQPAAFENIALALTLAGARMLF